MSPHPLPLEPLQRLLGSARETPLLHMSIALALQQRGRQDEAVAHLRTAVERDPAYAAAWRLLGLLLAEGGDRTAARDAFTHGIAAARTRGDRQLEKELGVRLRRLDRQA
ncbi:tetratricopeptide repeat protein [Coralloluteibacterium stylophorae]|uniref:Tetratricopeptide repeat protein n=1 Tax=Coralloluteibacterium stylophorae TaxID=1776034 RepID=A0AAP2G2N7_9GAMM|nr:tetratricopeptide repeat protein [Coralloluteibacterium stylophorae]MBS7458628.1 tetratricopeptide repeat protein [Coralloluteibacterium stylophorae]